MNYLNNQLNITKNNPINIKKNNINNENYIHDEIIDEVERVFLEAFKLVNNDVNEDANKDALLYILINDIIQFDKSKMDGKFDAANILDSVCNIIDESMDNLEDKISNKNNSHMVEIKKIFLKKKTDISKKIRDCNQSLKKLKKLYLNKNIENYIGNTNVNTLNLKNINTLHSNNKTHNYKLGEFFARFIFNNIKYSAPGAVIPAIDPYSQGTFYDDFLIESFFNDSITAPEFNTTFDDVDNNFKYWLILFFLTVQMFSQNPDYSKLFKQTLFKKFMEELISYKKSNKKKSNKKKSKKRGGGKKQKQKKFNALISLVDKKDKHTKSDSSKTHNQKEQVNPRDMFKDILSIKVNGNETLNSIYIDKFQTKLKDYLLYFIKNSGTYSHGGIIGGIIDPNIQRSYSEILCKKIFTNDYVSLEQITTLNKDNNFNKKKLTFGQLPSEFKERITLSIYNILILLLYNFEKTNEFIKKVKSKLIILLYYLFNIKRSIYKYYIERVDSLFNLNISNNRLNNRSNNRSNNSSNIVYNNETPQKKISKTKDNTKPKNNTLIEENINKKIEIIQRKIDSIKSKRADINNDEKILILETKMKQLIIKKLEQE